MDRSSFYLIGVVALVGAYMFTPSVARADKIENVAAYGDWSVQLSQSSLMTEALTENLSGDLMALLCAPSVSKCVYYLSSAVTCTPDSTIPVLVNSTIGGVEVEAKCTQLAGSYYDVIQETSEITQVVGSCDTIGFAMPMQDGTFQVLRFSLVGAQRATIKAAALDIEIAKDAGYTQ